MTEITGLTAARMLEIEANSVVDGNIVVDDLILTKHDGSTINAGNVRGPIGPEGPEGGDPTVGSFRATRGSDTSLARGNPINLTEVFDISSSFSAGVFTVPVDGIYHFEWSLVFRDPIAVGDWVQSRLRLNSGILMKGSRIIGNGNGQNISLGSATVNVVAGDALSVDMDSPAAVSYPISGEAATMFGGHLVGRIL